MGLLDFNISELTTRLRAGLAVKGRMPMALEDMIAPTAQVINLDRPPYRKDGLFYQLTVIGGPTAGQFTVAKLENNGDAPAILTYFKLQALSAGNVTHFLQFEAGAPGGLGGFTLPTGEDATVDTAGLRQMRRILTVKLGTGTQVPAPVLDAASLLDHFVLAQNGIYIANGVERLLTIPPRSCFTWYAGTVNTSFSLTCQVQVVQG